MDSLVGMISGLAAAVLLQQYEVTTDASFSVTLKNTFSIEPYSTDFTTDRLSAFFQAARSRPAT